jgi:hypothetical protein
MSVPTSITLAGAVEGVTDEIVLRRIVEAEGGTLHRIQVQHGKSNLKRALPGYNAAARWSPWVVLVDLDRDFPCASALVAEWLPSPSVHMRLRVVVRQIEAWLLADAERFSTFFSVRQALVPATPDSLVDAKATALNVLQHSRRRQVRDEMLPRPGAGRRVGPAYSAGLIEYVSNVDRGWRPHAAAKHSPSLARCLVRLRDLLA